MTRYLLSRLIWSLLTLLLFLTISFFLLELIMPYDFTLQFSMMLTRAERQELQRQLGLDQPMGLRYVRWMQDLLRGDLGRSFYGPPVNEIIGAAVPPSLLVFLTGIVLAFILGLNLAKVTTWNLPSWLGTSMTFGAIGINTMFPPWLAFLLTYVLAKEMTFAQSLLRPAFGGIAFGALDERIWGTFPHDPTTVCTWMVLAWLGSAGILMAAHWGLMRFARKGIPILLATCLGLGMGIGFWAAFGFYPQALDLLDRAWLPMTAFILLTFGETMLIMRTTMTDTRKEGFVQAARAKGLSRNQLRDRHVVRNALLPVISRLVIAFPAMIISAVIIEDVFNWPGLGSTLANAIYQQDIPVSIATLLYLGLATLIARLLIDVINALLDPRIRFQSKS